MTFVDPQPFVLPEDVPLAGIEALIEASSLGTPEAKALRASVPPEVARRVVARSYEIGVAGTSDVLPWTGRIVVTDSGGDEVSWAALTGRCDRLCPIHGSGCIQQHVDDDDHACGFCTTDSDPVRPESGLSVPLGDGTGQARGSGTLGPRNDS